MANPEISYTWGRGWKCSERIKADPGIALALADAYRGIEYFGIEYRRPKKAEIHRVNKLVSGMDQGEATSSKDFALFVAFNATRKLCSSRQIAQTAAIAVHEVTHCARRELYRLNTLEEAAATEGLAYVAEELYVRHLCAGQVKSRFTHADLKYDADLEESFVIACHAPWRPNQGVHKEWFIDMTSGPMPKGALFGVRNIYPLIDQGYTLPELMVLPSQEMLGYEAAA